MGQRNSRRTPSLRRLRLSGKGAATSGHGAKEDWETGRYSTAGQGVDKGDKSPSTYADATQDKWEINPDDLQLTKMIGKDYDTTMWKGTWKNSVDVCIYTLTEGIMDREDFLRDAETVRHVRHPNIACVLGVCSRGSPVQVVTEFPSRGCLDVVLRSKELDLVARLAIAVQVCSAMAYLEDLGLIYTEVEARTISLDEDYACKLTAFGAIKSLEDAQRNSGGERCLDITWTAPEVLHSGIHSYKSVVWSFGVLMTEILSKGAHPFRGFHNQEILSVFQDGAMEPPHDLPPKLRDLIKECWNRDPQNRPTFAHLRDMLEDYAREL